MRPKIGVIGAGLMGTAHGKAIRYCLKNGLVDGELVAICESDPARRDGYAKASGARIVTDDAGALIGSPEVNTVYICTPTYNHRELALQALSAGKALFCEKPLAFTAEDAAVMRDAAKRAGVTHQVGLVMRFSAVMNVTRELVREPAAGRAMAAVMVDDQFFPIQGHYNSTWRGDVALVGAGTLLEHAIHDVDVLVWYFGRVQRVYGVIRNFFGKEGIEDVSSATLEFAGGPVVSHVSVWHNLLHRGSSRRMNILCEHGQFSWDDDDWSGAIRAETNAAGCRHELSRDDVAARYAASGAVPGALRPLIVAGYSGQDYLQEDYAFLKAVSEDRPAYPDFDVAVYAHQVVDAIYASARSAQPVDLPPDARPSEPPPHRLPERSKIRRDEGPRGEVVSPSPLDGEGVRW